MSQLTPEKAVEIMLDECYQYYGVGRSTIMSKSREYKTALPYRKAIAVILNKYCGFSLVISGKAVGRDHTTIMHHRDHHVPDYERWPEYAEIYERLLARLRDSGLITKSKEAIRLSECRAIISQHIQPN